MKKYPFTTDPKMLENNGMGMRRNASFKETGVITYMHYNRRLG
jgi:hypothetical protein